MWYAIQVETGREERALALLKEAARAAGLDGSFDELFVPMRRLAPPAGSLAGARPVEAPLFPGYLIAVARKDCLDDLNRVLHATRAFARLLAYDGVFVPLHDDEVQWICAFTSRRERVVGVSEGFVERGRVTVVSGPLVGREARIVKVNRRKRTARVELSICGRVVECELALNLMRENRARRKTPTEGVRGGENE